MQDRLRIRVRESCAGLRVSGPPTSFRLAVTILSGTRADWIKNNVNVGDSFYVEGRVGKLVQRKGRQDGLHDRCYRGDIHPRPSSLRSE